jgi:hypothetical protein
MYWQPMQALSDSFCPRRAAITTVLLVLLAPILMAKPAAVTLAELVQHSPVIVLGRLETEGDSVPKPGSGRVSFKSLRVLKGDASFGGRNIQLCNSPPPMREYPDLSKLTGDVVLFLYAEKGGCFEYSNTTTSVVGVRDGKVTTAAIADQPIDQPFNVFLEKLRRLGKPLR